MRMGTDKLCSVMMGSSWASSSSAKDTVCQVSWKDSSRSNSSSSMRTFSRVNSSTSLAEMVRVSAMSLGSSKRSPWSVRASRT